MACLNELCSSVIAGGDNPIFSRWLFDGNAKEMFFFALWKLNYFMAHLAAVGDCLIDE